jgi:hypothetical protein
MNAVFVSGKMSHWQSCAGVGSDMLQGRLSSKKERREGEEGRGMEVDN